MHEKMYGIYMGLTVSPSTFFYSLFSGSTVAWCIPWSVKWNNMVSTVRTKCCAPAIVMHWQLTSHLPVCACFSNSVAWDYSNSTPNHLKNGVHNARSAPVDLSFEPYHSICAVSQVKMYCKREIPTENTLCLIVQ